MKTIVSILILVALASGQHSRPAKRAILGKGYGKVEVESIDKSVEVRPNLGTQNALYLSPPIKDLPIQDSTILQPTINHLEPPYPPKESEKHYHADALQDRITSVGQLNEPQEQRHNNVNYLPPTQSNGHSAALASSYNAEGYLPPNRNNPQITQPQMQQYQNQPFQATKTASVQNQPTYKDYIARTEKPETHEEYYKAPGYLPPTNNQDSFKLSLVSSSPFLQNLQQHNALGYSPPSSENKVVFPQSGSTYEAPGYLPPSSRSLGQTTTRLLPVKDNFQISQQGYTEAFIAKNLHQNHDYSASDYLPPSNLPLTPQNSNIETQPNVYGAPNSAHPPKPIQSHTNSIQTHSTPEYLPPPNNVQQKNQVDGSYSAPGYLPPQGNVQINKPTDHGSAQHQTYSNPGYLPPNQQENSDPTDIDVRIGNDETAQHGINDHNGYDYSKPQGPAFNEGHPQNNIQTLIDESRNSYQAAEQSHKTQNSVINYQNSARHATLENQIQTIKIIRENVHGQQESIRTIQIIAENDQSNSIRTIKILKDSQPVNNFQTIKLIDYSSASANNYLPPQSIASNNYSPNKLSNQQAHDHNIKNLAPSSASFQGPLSSSNNGYLPPGPIPTNNYSPNKLSSQQVNDQIQAPLSSSNNGYLPPEPIATNNYSPNKHSAQQIHHHNIKNLEPPNSSIQAPLSSSNNGYLPPEPIATNNYSPNKHSGQQIHHHNIKNLEPPSTSIQAPLSSSNNGYLPPEPIHTNNYSPNKLSSQQVNDQHITNLAAPSTSIQAPLALSSYSNNGYLPPRPDANNYSPNAHLSQQVNSQLNSLPFRSSSIHTPAASSVSNNGYLPPSNQPLSAISNSQIISNHPSHTPATFSSSHINPQVDIIKIISENNHNGEDPAIYASVAAANLNNVKTIQIVNGRNAVPVDSRQYEEAAKGYPKTRLLRFYRRF